MIDMKHSIRLVVGILLLLFLLGSCAKQETEQSPPAGEDAASSVSGQSSESSGVQVLRGFATYGHEVRAFRPCGSDEYLWAIDRGGILWEVHGNLTSDYKTHDEIFVVIEGRKGPPPADGFGADYPGTIHVDRVLYAAMEGFRCDYDWDGFTWHAYGNEPFWTVIMSDGSIRLKVIGRDDVVWPDSEIIEAEGAIRYIGCGNEAAPEIELTITPTPCQDSMSGAYFAYSSVVRTGSDEFEGCALWGSN